MKIVIFPVNANPSVPASWGQLGKLASKRRPTGLWVCPLPKRTHLWPLNILGFRERKLFFSGKHARGCKKSEPLCQALPTGTFFTSVRVSDFSLAKEPLNSAGYGKLRFQTKTADSVLERNEIEIERGKMHHTHTEVVPKWGRPAFTHTLRAAVWNEWENSIHYFYSIFWCSCHWPSNFYWSYISHVMIKRM